MNWIEHMEAAARSFNEEAEKHKQNNDIELALAANKDAAAIQQLIIDIENGKTQEVKV